LTKYLESLEQNRGSILISEFGALLHDIGKCHQDFIKSKSVEKSVKFHHTEIEQFLNDKLLNLLKNNLFKIYINNEDSDIFRLINDHHKPVNKITKILQTCDRKNSADDKGIVRMKQYVEKTFISTPFGFIKEKINLNCLQQRFTELQENLSNLLIKIVNNQMGISDIRETLLITLKQTFSYALGETRVPANDVTLWDHSFSTASLFKSILASAVLEQKFRNSGYKWRIFGIFFDGMGFINKGKKIAEIQNRNLIIKEIKNKLKKTFEVQYPIGNVIYEDLDGIYFTFPDFKDSVELAKECVEKVINTIYAESNNEIWPSFYLSKPSKTLTIIANILKFVSKTKKFPKMTPTLFVGGKKAEYFREPIINSPEEIGEICHVCKIRIVKTNKDRCDICENLIKGRLSKWLEEREDTIWMDEVSDINNRIAIISLVFNLNRWLDGTMIGTIYSQSFKDWLYGKKCDKKKCKSTIELLREENITILLKPNKSTVYELLDEVVRVDINDKSADRKKARGILNTFLQDLNISSSSKLKEHINNIKERIDNKTFNAKTLAAALFTKNTSPARIYRIWSETNDFFYDVIKELEENTYNQKWKRVSLSIDLNNFNLNLKTGKILEESTYIIKIRDLKPEKVTVFYEGNGQFYTIESLRKYKYQYETGEIAVKKALKEKGFYFLAKEDEPNNNLLTKEIKPKYKNMELEKYLPFISITQSPSSLRLIVPSRDSMKIIERIILLYNQRFSKVIGKLSLNIKLIVSKKKFPLYILFDAEKKMLENDIFRKYTKMNIWWDITNLRTDKFYGYYPIKMKEDKKCTLDDISLLSMGRKFFLCPGYFDFEFLLGTTDRYRIYYNQGKRGDIINSSITGRPYYFHQVKAMLDLWDILSQNLSNSQINFIEEMLIGKLREWKNVVNSTKDNVFRKFITATLQNAFREEWNNLEDERKQFLVNSALNGLLIDTIILFRHIIKEIKEVK